MQNLPLGTVRFSIGLENSKGRVNSMTEPFHTPKSIRDYIKKNLQKGAVLRVIKYTLTMQTHCGVSIPTWFVNLNTDKKGLRKITV